MNTTWSSTTFSELFKRDPKLAFEYREQVFEKKEEEVVVVSEPMTEQDKIKSYKIQLNKLWIKGIHFMKDETITQLALKNNLI